MNLHMSRLGRIHDVIVAGVVSHSDAVVVVSGDIVLYRVFTYI